MRGGRKGSAMVNRTMSRLMGIGLRVTRDHIMRVALARLIRLVMGGPRRDMMVMVMVVMRVRKRGWAMKMIGRRRTLTRMM